MRIFATAAAVLLLAGCGSNKAAEGAPPAAPSTVTVSPTPTRPPAAQRYVTVEALKDAAVGLGYDCPAWVQHTVIPSADESGTCSEESAVNPDVFMTFANQAHMDAQRPVFESKVGVGGALLIGPNWIINADDVPSITRLAATLGGAVDD